MRWALVLALSAAILPSTAMAQQAGTPMGDLQDLNRFATRGFMNQWAATRPAAMSGLSQVTRRWIKEQVQEQAEKPRSVAELQAAIQEVAGKDIKAMAKSERAKPEDISGGILLKILVDTHNALIREAGRNPAGEPGQRSWEERIAESDENVQTAMALESNKAIELVRD